MSHDTELHVLGREVTGQIQSQKADGVPFLTSPFSGRIIPWMRAVLGSERTLGLCESQITRRSFAFTNLGLLERLDVQERYRDLEIEELSRQDRQPQEGRSGLSRSSSSSASNLLASGHTAPAVCCAQNRFGDLSPG